jgi:hypothetical protein
MVVKVGVKSFVEVLTTFWAVRIERSLCNVIRDTKECFSNLIDILIGKFGFYLCSRIWLNLKVIFCRSVLALIEVYK